MFLVSSKITSSAKNKTLFAYYCMLGFLYIYFYPFANYLTNSEFDGVLNPESSARQVYLFYISSIPIAVLIGRFLLPIIVPLGPARLVNASNNGRTPRVFFLFQTIAIISLGCIFILTDIDFSILFNRQNRNEGFFVTQAWVIFVYFIQSILFVSIYNYKCLSKFEIILSALIFIMFSFLEVAGIGARRYTVAIIIFYLYRSGILYYLIFYKIGRLLLILSIIAMIFFGSTREYIFHEATGGILQRDISELMISSNEFTEIGGGIAKSVAEFQSIDNLRIGATLLNIPLYFIPRAIFDDKPLSLTNQYEIPISIFSELFINFHILSLFFIILISFLVYRVSIKGSANYFSCLFAAYALDFIRADFASIFYCMTFSIFFYCLMTRLIKNNRYCL